MSNSKEITRRDLIKRGVGLFASLSLPFSDLRNIASAAEFVSSQSSFRTPDATIYGAPLAYADFDNGDFSWGPMNFSSRTVSTDPVIVEGDLAYQPLIRRDTVLDAALTLAIVELRLIKGGVGITHLLPDSDRDQVSVELRPDGDMRALVRKGINGANVDQTVSIGRYKPGDNSFYLAMMFSNSGSTFGAFGPDGIVRNETDLELPPVEVGEPSTLIAYTFGKDAKAEVLRTMIASQKTK